MNRIVSIIPIVAICSIGCSSAPEAKAPTAPPPAATGSPAPAGTTCIGDQCGLGSAAPLPAPSSSGTAVAPPPPAFASMFVVEVEGVQMPVSSGMQLEVQVERMTPMYNLAAKPDCSDTQVDGLVAMPGPLCLVWADTVALKLHKGDVKPARWRVGSSVVNFTVAVK